LRSLCALFVFTCQLAAQGGASEAEPEALMTSRVYTWEGFQAEPTSVGERREVAHQPTATLDVFQSHISTLLPALTTHEPHRHAQEELVLIKEGTLDVYINGKVERAGPGALLFFAANDWHNV